MEPNNISMAQNDVAPTASATPAPVSEKKKSSGLLILTILFAVLAIGGIGFGVWAMMDGNAQKANYDKQIADLKAQNSKLLDQIAEGGGSMDDGNGTSSSVDPEDYIYIGEWGIKIKKIDDLDYLSYTFGVTSDLSNVLYVNGVSGGDGRLPSFANMLKNPSGCGAVSRFSIGSEPDNYKAQTPVYSDGQYNYYYSGPQDVYSTGDEEKGLEMESVDYIKDMISDPDNYFKI